MPSGPERVRFTVVAADAGKRLDLVLAANVPGLSRRKARVLLDIGGVYVDKERVKKAGRLVRGGQTIEAVLGGALHRAEGAGTAARVKEAAKLPEYRIVHEDEHLLVVEKPAGLLTAPTPESDRNNLADLLARRPVAAAPLTLSERSESKGSPRDPAAKKGAERSKSSPIFVVHRVDLDTSGLLVFAKTDDANRALSELFRTHDIEREYLAVVEGRFPDDVPTVDRPIGGKRAVTHFTVARRLALATVVRARLETGRTHQIRIHTRAIGHPVLGDVQHGRAAPEGLRPPPRMALHAAKLGFTHPATKAVMLFESPLPSELSSWVDSLAP